jgi:Protein of unknown function (DUF2802)
MFEILPNPSLESIALVGRAALLIGAFWIFALAFIRWRRADERQSQELYARLDRAFGELRSLHETVTVMNARLESLSERAESEPRSPPVAAAVGAQRGYDLATRLAKNGASPEELVASCGVTRHEAELLSRLHGSKSRESASASWQMRAATEAAAHMQPAPQQPTPANGRKRGSLLSVIG